MTEIKRTKDFHQTDLTIHRPKHWPISPMIDGSKSTNDWWQTLHKSFSQYHHGYTDQSHSTIQTYNIIDWQTRFTWLWRCVVETPVTNNSSFRNYPRLGGHTIRITDTPGFKLFNQMFQSNVPFSIPANQMFGTRQWNLSLLVMLTQLQCHVICQAQTIHSLAGSRIIMCYTYYRVIGWFGKYMVREWCKRMSPKYTLSTKCVVWILSQLFKRNPSNGLWAVSHEHRFEMLFAMYLRGAESKLRAGELKI